MPAVVPALPTAAPASTFHAFAGPGCSTRSCGRCPDAAAWFGSCQSRMAVVGHTVAFPPPACTSLKRCLRHLAIPYFSALQVEVRHRGCPRNRRSLWEALCAAARCVCHSSSLAQPAATDSASSRCSSALTSVALACVFCALRVRLWGGGGGVNVIGGSVWAVSGVKARSLLRWWGGGGCPGAPRIPRRRCCEALLHAVLLPHEAYEAMTAMIATATMTMPRREANRMKRR